MNAFSSAIVCSPPPQTPRRGGLTIASVLRGSRQSPQLVLSRVELLGDLGGGHETRQTPSAITRDVAYSDSKTYTV